MGPTRWSSVASGVSSSLTLVIKIFEYSYALRAVDKQTQDYLVIAEHAWENIERCQHLLHNLRDTLSISEIQVYEKVIDDTSKAAREVLILLEPARVDTETDFKIHLWSRVMWVMNDNSNIAAALRRLNTVHTTLTQNISTLRLMREVARTREEPSKQNISPLTRFKHENWGLTPKPSMQSLQSRRTESSYNASSTTLLAELEDQPTQTHGQYLTPTERYSLVPSISAPAVPYSNIVEGMEATRSEPQRAVPFNTGMKPRTWLEYQTMKSNRLRDGGSESGVGRNSWQST